MPFRSEAQRKFLWKNEPKIAEKWTKEHGSKIKSAAKSRLKKQQSPVGSKK